MTAPGTCSASASAKPGETTESVTIGTAKRSYIVHVPPSYDGKKLLPVVVDYHPMGGTGSSWKGSTTWGALADKEGFILLWPDGVGNSWNVGRCCSTAQSQGVDDVAFTRAMLASLEQKACVDTHRIYATGCSNGGGMAFKVGCDAADVIAAIAPVDFDCVTGDSPTPSCGKCSPSRPIPELQFRGTNDTAVPYKGGSGPKGTVFPGAEATFSEWSNINKCSGDAEPIPGMSGCNGYTTCADGVQTALCTVQNGTHCGNYQSFDIVNLAWGLFKKSQLP